MKAVAIVLGGAACLGDDIANLQKLAGSQEWMWSCHTIGANLGGARWTGRLDHWACLHPEKLRKWERERSDLGLGRGYVTWSRRNAELVDMVIPHWGSGSTGLFGVTVAQHLQIEKVVLCGVPMDSSPHLDGREVWEDWLIHRDGWERNRDRVQGRVRSMSGWTSEFLGQPTREWLK